jgi:hypothetical protein
MDKGDVFLKGKELPLLKTSSNSGYKPFEKNNTDGP